VVLDAHAGEFVGAFEEGDDVCLFGISDELVNGPGGPGGDDGFFVQERRYAENLPDLCEGAACVGLLQSVDREGNGVGSAVGGEDDPVAVVDIASGSGQSLAGKEVIAC